MVMVATAVPVCVIPCQHLYEGKNKKKKEYGI